MDKISIIVPVYNVEKYLERCVKSIQNQTYKNIEIILVDDGSPDNCGKMCDELAKEDERIKVIHKQNGGLSDARNYGIANTTGKYIGFVDSDDYIKEDMFEILYNEIKENDADIASISNAMVRANGEWINGTDSKKRYVYEGIEILKQLLLHNTIKNYVWDKLYKAEVIKVHKFATGFSYEDVLFSYEVLSKVKRITYYDSVEYFYVKHKETISATCSEKNVKDYLHAIIERFNTIKETENKDIEIYNYYAIANTATHAYYKVMLSNLPLDVYHEQLEFLKQNVKYVLDNFEDDVTKLFSVYQKACFYMLLYDEELFINFLRDRQRKNKSNSST